MARRRGARPKDIYGQFALVRAFVHGSDTTETVTGKLNTGLSIRHGIIWLIHMVEFFTQELHQINADNDLSWVLSTVPEEPVIPELTDKGVIAKSQLEWTVLTSGGGAFELPAVRSFLPPIPIAAPSLNVYFKTADNSSPLYGALVEARIMYTTQEVDDPALYTEIAEVWGG